MDSRPPGQGIRSGGMFNRDGRIASVRVGADDFAAGAGRELLIDAELRGEPLAPLLRR